MRSNQRLQRWWWNAERFGLTPQKAASRLRWRKGPKLLSNSLPKAGTHLLERALCRHPRLYRGPFPTLHRRSLGNRDLDWFTERLQPNQILVTHLEYSKDRCEALERHSVRSIFMVRDPRDIVVSQAHFIRERPSHAHHAVFSPIEDLGDRMRLVIEGSVEAGFPSLRQRLEAYSGWLESDSLIVRYEDIVGEGGGGDRTRQLEVLHDIFTHIDLPLEPSQVESLAAQTFSTTSPTFRRGTTQQWRQHFDNRLLKLYESEVADLAAAYGYG